MNKIGKEDGAGDGKAESVILIQRQDLLLLQPEGEEADVEEDPDRLVEERGGIVVEPRDLLFPNPEDDFYFRHVSMLFTISTLFATSL